MECDLRTLDPRVGLTPECIRLFHSFQWKRAGNGHGTASAGPRPWQRWDRHGDCNARQSRDTVDGHRPEGS